ncbi:MAG: hypothetical protein ACE5GW_11945, partial [Planctomycetota bacterium]
MTPGRYSLCVIHHGDAGLTEACLRSTLALEVEPVERILLWNDPSSPPDALSGELLAAARLVDPGENLGFAGGGNRAMKEAIDGARAAGTRLDALLLLNNDTVVDAAAPRLLLEELRRDARIAITGPRILEADGGAIWHDGGTIEWPEGRVVSRGHGEPPAAAAAEVFDVDFVCGCAPMIRRAPFEEAGGFDERYFLYHEDTDLGL